jgi:GNAT superfamily N-acetyltransferase
MICRATAADGDTLLRLIRGLADYEHLDPPDDAAAERFKRDLAEGTRFEALLVERDGEAIGYALYFDNYSTFRALPVLYMEDLFVVPEARGSGAGFALFRAVVEAAIRRGCCEVAWNVLDWNKPSIDFYERAGAVFEKQWLQYTLSRESMERVLEASSEPKGSADGGGS